MKLRSTAGHEYTVDLDDEGEAEIVGVVPLNDRNEEFFMWLPFDQISQLYRAARDRRDAAAMVRLMGWTLG